MNSSDCFQKGGYNMSKTENKSAQTLRRNLTLFEATMYSISFVIGSGIFMKPATVLNATGSSGLSLILWIGGGLISLASALAIAEVASNIPKLGGQYAYVNELYGPFFAYIYGWISVLISCPAGGAASSILTATLLSGFIPMSDVMVKVTAVAVLWFLTGIQMITTKGSMKIQVAGTIGKLVPIFLIVIVGLVTTGGAGTPINMSAVGDPAKASMAGALLGVLWAFDGWVAVTTLGAELKDPAKNLPKSIAMSLIFITAVYAIFNVVAFKHLTPAELIAIAAAGKSVGVEVAVKLFGNVGAIILTVGMLVSVATTNNAQIMNGARSTLAMARRNQLPGSVLLRKLHPKFDTPYMSLLFYAIVSMIYILSGTFDSTTDLVVFIVWIFFIATTFGVFIIRRNPDKYPNREKLYKVPLYPITPIVGIVGGAYILFETVRGAPVNAMIGAAVVAVGIPIYMYLKKFYKDTPIEEEEAPV